MQVRARRGRVFNESDGIAGAPAVIVNESFAAKAWPGEDPIGRHFRLAREAGLARGQALEPWLTVVGMVPDIQQNFQRPVERAPLIYLPYGAGADPQRVMFLIARTTVPPSSMAEAWTRTCRSTMCALSKIALR